MSGETYSKISEGGSNVPNEQPKEPPVGPVALPYGQRVPVDQLSRLLGIIHLAQAPRLSPSPPSSPPSSLPSQAQALDLTTWARIRPPPRLASPQLPVDDAPGVRLGATQLGSDAVALETAGGLKLGGFNGVLGGGATNPECFRLLLKPQCARVASQAHHATLVCYGPAGAGKSHTLFGKGASPAAGGAEEGLCGLAFGHVLSLLGEAGGEAGTEAAAEGGAPHLRVAALSVQGDRVVDLAAAAAAALAAPGGEGLSPRGSSDGLAAVGCAVCSKGDLAAWLETWAARAAAAAPGAAMVIRAEVTTKRVQLAQAEVGRAAARVPELAAALAAARQAYWGEALVEGSRQGTNSGQDPRQASFSASSTAFARQASYTPPPEFDPRSPRPDDPRSAFPSQAPPPLAPPPPPGSSSQACGGSPPFERSPQASPKAGESAVLQPRFADPRLWPEVKARLDAGHARAARALEQAEAELEAARHGLDRARAAAGPRLGGSVTLVEVAAAAADEAGGGGQGGEAPAALRDCLRAAARITKFPALAAFRQTALTRVLEPSLGPQAGSCSAALLVHVAAAAAHGTLSPGPDAEPDAEPDAGRAEREAVATLRYGQIFTVLAPASPASPASPRMTRTASIKREKRPPPVVTPRSPTNAGPANRGAEPAC